MSDLHVVELPSGGRAWCRRKLGHGRAKEIRRAFRRQIPPRLLDALVSARTAQTAPDGTPPARLNLETPELLEASDHIEDYQAVVIANVVVRWQGVYHPDDATRELSFPDDLEELDDDDFAALYAGAEEARSGDAADPPSGSENSFSSSLPESRSQTPSPMTSETPS